MLSNYNVLTNQYTSSLQPFIAEKAITFNQGMIAHLPYGLMSPFVPYVTRRFPLQRDTANVRLPQGLSVPRLLTAVALFRSRWLH